jgi:hypothetical protein
MSVSGLPSGGFLHRIPARQFGLVGYDRRRVVGVEVDGRRRVGIELYRRALGKGGVLISQVRLRLWEVRRRPTLLGGLPKAAYWGVPTRCRNSGFRRGAG